MSLALADSCTVWAREKVPESNTALEKSWKNAGFRAIYILASGFLQPVLKQVLWAGSAKPVCSFLSPFQIESCDQDFKKEQSGHSTEATHSHPNCSPRAPPFPSVAIPMPVHNDWRSCHRLSPRGKSTELATGRDLSLLLNDVLLLSPVPRKWEQGFPRLTVLQREEKHLETNCWWEGCILIWRVVFVQWEARAQCRGTHDGSSDGIAKCPELTCGLWKEWSAHDTHFKVFI